MLAAGVVKGRLLPAARLRPLTLRWFATAMASRNAEPGRVKEDDIRRFERLLSDGGTLLTRESDADAMKPYTQDWTRKWGSDNCPAVLLPKSLKEVSSILSYCNERRIPVVPQGGNTGLTGGGVPIRDEVVLSLAKMKRIISLDNVSGVLVCEAGCVLEELDTWLRAHGYIMPLDLGAKGSCMIGGNISTNAGGLRYIRYGSLHANVLGLEVVLPNGQVLDMIHTVKKDNTGFDLKHLFIGAEGTLGVVTKVALSVPTAPKAVNVALVGLKSFDKVQKLLLLAKRSLGEILSAVELMDAHSLDMVLTAAVKANLTNVRSPLSERYPFYVLLETSGSHETHDADKVAKLLEQAVEEEIIADGTLAQDLNKAKEIWHLREEIPVAMETLGYVIKYDISLPLPVFYEAVERTRERLRAYPEMKVVGYGHLGDSNLHLNIGMPKGYKYDHAEVNDAVLQFVIQHRGSISAEHGLGQQKRDYVPLIKTQEVLKTMFHIKQLFDPNGIMNPGKYLPDAQLQK